MKKSIFNCTVVFITVFILIFNSSTVYATEEIKVELDGAPISFDVPPQIINGRTMVPMRKIFESLGAVVTWDSQSRTATGRRGDTTVNVSIDSTTLFKNGVPKTLDVAPALIDSRTLVPARAIAESFDCKVDWLAETRTVKIETKGNTSYEKTILNASEIAEKTSPSVFYIEVYDANSQPIACGSGFFVTANGVAVTNYHVIEDTASAKITTINGDIFNVSGVIAFDKSLDVAIIKVDTTSIHGKTVSGFPYVSMADSNYIKAGQRIYALGSPAGLQNTISDGIISNVNQIVNGESFIQITAPISHGSSGGALVNEYGEVLGITSAGYDDAENIGFVIPINIIKMFDFNGEIMPYSDFYLNNNSFVLDVHTTAVELTVGEVFELLVYAKGKGENWSIYWDTEYEHLVDCKWGDWLEDYTSICPLNIKALNPGTAVITVYSDVDFRGIDITVNIKPQPVSYYPSSCVYVPDYTSITGIPLTGIKQYEKNDMYIYGYYDIGTVQKYIDYLLYSGFSLYKSNTESDIASYYYLTPDKRDMIAVDIAYNWNEVWIQIPR